jgi:hypothetical protein
LEEIHMLGWWSHLLRSIFQKVLISLEYCTCPNRSTWCRTFIVIFTRFKNTETNTVYKILSHQAHSLIKLHHLLQELKEGSNLSSISRQVIL